MTTAAGAVAPGAGGGPLQHVVLFSFPEPLSDADAADMRAQIERWPADIGSIRAIRFGTDLTGERTRGYSHLLWMEFGGADALHRYQRHPVHQQFLQWVTDRRCTPLAFDYHLDESTIL